MIETHGNFAEVCCCCYSSNRGESFVKSWMLPLCCWLAVAGMKTILRCFFARDWQVWELAAIHEPKQSVKVYEISSSLDTIRISYFFWKILRSEIITTYCVCIFYERTINLFYLVGVHSCIKLLATNKIIAAKTCQVIFCFCHGVHHHHRQKKSSPLLQLPWL